MSTHTSNSTGSKTGPMTRSQIIKSYGGRPNFQASFGLKMDPDSIEEGNAILDAFEQNDREDWEAEQEEKKKNAKK
ncbi:hypothetical protein K438DRAFT_2017018 [Mycena galopus ATCC 62051]|nr:hypothetical protein K438DRAFT_2017018 [Mycena galopus ATCC 62051]